MLSKHTASGRLKFTASYGEAASFADLHFLGVGAPERTGDNAYDLSALFAAVRRLTPHIHRPAVVVDKSTVPVGTVPRVADILRAATLAGRQVEVAWNPEFLRESFAIEDTLYPDRLVLGFADEGTHGEAVLRQCFGTIIEAGTPTITTSLATAELVKGAANAFLATKISFINTIAEACEASGANVHQLAEAQSRHPHRPEGPAARARLRRRLPAQGPPRLHGPRRRTRHRPGPRHSPRGRRDQQPPPGTHGRPRPRTARRHLQGQAHRRLGSGLQPRHRRHSRLTRPRRHRKPPPARRRGHRL
ncbi:hypothetical protein [Streptomyces sp. NPDC000405]|uniref:hypothetical protein n=1 Tax=Streptomyces sp. NPDC000405 TaxID=3161033 RepID=UPI00398C8B40